MKLFKNPLLPTIELSHEKNSGLNTMYLYLTRITFEIHFLSSKSTWEANKRKEHAIAWKWPP